MSFTPDTSYNISAVDYNRYQYKGCFYTLSKIRVYKLNLLCNFVSKKRTCSTFIIKNISLSK